MGVREVPSGVISINKEKGSNIDSGSQSDMMLGFVSPVERVVYVNTLPRVHFGEVDWGKYAL